MCDCVRSCLWKQAFVRRGTPPRTVEKMSINKTRGWLYFFARILGDYQAVRTGKVGKRIVRRAAGKGTGRMLRKILR